MLRACRALLLGAVFIACASTPIPAATGPIRWSAVGDEKVPELLTIDPDGDERETKLWLAVIDDQGYLRTSDTRWFANIERDPKVVLRIGGAAYPLRAEPITDPSLRARIHEAFRAKYGWEDRLIGWFSNESSADILRLVAR